MSNKVQIQQDIETVFSNHNLMAVLKAEFDSISDEHSVEEEKPFLNDLLIQIHLHRQTDPETLVGILSPKHGTPQEVADLIVSMAEQDYLNMSILDGVVRFSRVFTISEDVQHRLDMYQFPMPMIVPPLEVKRNHDTGYYTSSEPIVSNDRGHTGNKDVCLDHINRVNHIPMTLDMDLVRSTEGEFKKPRRNKGEDFFEYNKRLRQAQIFYSTSREVMEGISAQSDVIFMTHKYDRRGRVYAKGYHINPQGTDFNKAVLVLAQKEIIT